MPTAASVVMLQAETPTPGVGPDELVIYWPLLTRIAWFLTGFLVVALLGWFIVTPALARVIRSRNHNNPTIQAAIPRYIRLLVLVIAFFIAAGTAGYGQLISNSALVIAAGTLAVGVAAQTVIGSLVSGTVLIVDPDFNVGDYIIWADGEGTIQSITLRVTRVRTPAGEQITVPNTVLTDQAITRPYGRPRYRLVDTIGLDYDADIDEAITQIEAAATDVEAIQSEPSPNAFVTEFGDDDIVVRSHYWIADPDPLDVLRARSAYVQAAKTRLDEAGVSISPAAQRDIQGRITVDEPA